MESAKSYVTPENTAAAVEVYETAKSIASTPTYTAPASAVATYVAPTYKKPKST